MRTFRTGLSVVVLTAVLAGSARGRGPEEETATIIASIKETKLGDPRIQLHLDELRKYLSTSKAAWPFLIECVNDPKCTLDAINVLHKMGPAARPALPALVMALRAEANTNAAPRIFETFVKIGAGPKDLLEPLVALIDDQRIKIGTETSNNYITRHLKAVEAVGRMGPAARSATLVLMGVLLSPEGMKQDNVARYVLDALAQIEPDAKDSVPGIQLFLQAKNGGTKRSAEVAYLRITKDPAAVKREVEMFLTAFKDKEGQPQVRNNAVEEFGKIGSLGKPAFPDLIAALNDNDMRVAAIKSLGMIGPEAKETIPMLLKLLEDRERGPSLIQPLLDSLRTIEPDGKAQVAVMRAVLEEYIAAPEKYRNLLTGPPYMDSVMQHFAKMGPNAADLVPVMIKLLTMMVANGYGQSFREWAIEGLTAIGPAAKSALPILDAGLKSGRFDPQIVSDAVTSIQGGGDVKPVDPVKPNDPVKPAVDPDKAKELIAGLKDPAKRKEAILAIAAAGAAGRGAEPALIELLRDPDREIRLLAAYALEKLETAK